MATTKADALKRATGTEAKAEDDPKAQEEARRAKLREQFDGVEISAELGGDVKVGVLVDVYPVFHESVYHEPRRGQVVKVPAKVADRGEKFDGLIRL